MSRLPRIAIIGRPNVGKSTLFNILTGTRNAVVKNQPGVTRDIQFGVAEWCGQEFEVVDTGGLTETKDTFSPMIKAAVLELVENVDALILVMDAKSGLCPEDHEIVRIAQKSEKPYIVAINKADRIDQMEIAKSEFYELGITNFISASFEQRLAIDELLEWVVEQFTLTQDERPKGEITLAIIGKPNAGKSSLCNRLLGENRMLVSNIAGTTVDAIDSRFIFNDQIMTIIDTAGIRRRSRQKEGVEVLSTFKSRDAILRCHMVLLVIDAIEGPSDQDAKLVEFALENNKGVMIVANKSDLGKELPEFRKTFREKIEREFHFFPDIPVSFISSLTGSGIKDLLIQLQNFWDKMNMRISTSHLNDFFTQVIRQAPAPVYGSKDVKFYYLTQTKQRPPSFIAFANFPDGVDNSYRRFLSKRIKEEWGLEGVPVRIYVMKKGGASLSARTQKAETVPELDTESVLTT